MKKVVYVLVYTSVVATGMVLANRKTQNQMSDKPTAVTAANGHRDDLKKWEASPDGVRYKKWEASAEGQKAHASVNKIKKQLTTFTNMYAVVTSVVRPIGSSNGFGLIVKINGDDYMVNFLPEMTDRDLSKLHKDLVQLNSLKINDKIIIKSHSAAYTGKSSRPVLSGDYLERDHKVIFSRDPKKGGC